MTLPRRLTIALLIATPGTTWGGMEKHTADLAKALADLGDRLGLVDDQAGDGGRLAESGDAEAVARPEVHGCDEAVGGWELR